jgi:hypothetical protein
LRVVDDRAIREHAAVRFRSEYHYAVFVYLREARRVLKPRGLLFLQTAPYLSPSGAHLPRLKIPLPLHLLVGRRAAFATSCWLGRHAPEWLDVDPEGSSFVTAARRSEEKGTFERRPSSPTSWHGVIRPAKVRPDSSKFR